MKFIFLLLFLLFLPACSENEKYLFTYLEENNDVEKPGVISEWKIDFDFKMLSNEDSRVIFNLPDVEVEVIRNQIIYCFENVGLKECQGADYIWRGTIPRYEAIEGVPPYTVVIFSRNGDYVGGIEGYMIPNNEGLRLNIYSFNYSKELGYGTMTIIDRGAYKN